MIWSRAQIAVLARMAPTHSAGQIAKELACGITRNAVIGKCHREGIVMRTGTRARQDLAVRQKQETASRPPVPRKRFRKGRPPTMVGEHTTDPEIDRIVSVVLPVILPDISAVPTGSRIGQHHRPRSAKMKAPTPPKPLPEVVADPICSHVDFEGLKSHHCRWPVADDERGVVRLYCGDRAEPDRSWCGVHARLAWTSPEERRRVA